MFDPKRVKHNGVPPPVRILGVVADRKAYSPETPLRLPPLTRDLEIDYTALSFAIPEKVRFRYRLEGADGGWHHAGTRREAYFNNLRPGSYRFHVIACNNDSVWNETGATLDFTLLQQIAGGNRNRDIAGRLFITEETVKVHVKHIMKKLGAKDRTGAVAIALRRGIIQL